MKADYKFISAKLYFLLFLSLISLIYLFSPKVAEAKYNIELANSPPYQRSIITSPNINSMLKGGSFLEVNWGPSTDPDRDPITYKLEFTENFTGYNESTIFSTIGEYISDSCFIHQLPCFDSDKAMYRIRAYDGKYYSMWRNSHVFTIDSTPPEV